MNATLRSLVDLRDRTLQKSRIAFSNRIGAVDRGSDTANAETRDMLEKYEARFID